MTYPEPPYIYTPYGASCAVCGRSFRNQLAATGEGGEQIGFADFDDSGAKFGYAPGVVGVAWICDEHVPAARTLGKLTTGDAIAELRRKFSITHFSLAPVKGNPELVLTETGPNRGKVCMILREMTPATPQETLDLLSQLPRVVLSAWTPQLRYWQERLVRAGATVEWIWD